MAVGRRYSPSSLPRYFLKMWNRYFSISGGVIPLESVTPSTLLVNGSLQSAYTVSSNWVNGFYPYSQLRYKILPILEKYGIPRGDAYIYMAILQHAFKQIVEKKDTSVEELVSRALTILFGEEYKKVYLIGTDVENVIRALEEIYALIGIQITINLTELMLPSVTTIAR